MEKITLRISDNTLLNNPRVHEEITHFGAMCKSLEVVTPALTRKRLNKLKINNNSQIHRGRTSQGQLQPPSLHPKLERGVPT